MRDCHLIPNKLQATINIYTKIIKYPLNLTENFNCKCVHYDPLTRGKWRKEVKIIKKYKFKYNPLCRWPSNNIEFKRTITDKLINWIK
jgi:hypothetical protein